MQYVLSTYCGVTEVQYILLEGQALFKCQWAVELRLAHMSCTCELLSVHRVIWAVLSVVRVSVGMGVVSVGDLRSSSSSHLIIGCEVLGGFSISENLSQSLIGSEVVDSRSVGDICLFMTRSCLALRQSVRH